MNPLQKNKIDIASLSPDEQRLFRLYGKLPSKADHLAKQLKERKYFDSGDYALSKAGKASSVDTGSVGSEHPLPENIPHLSSPSVGNAAQGGSGNTNVGPGSAHHGSIAGLGLGQQSGSPVKESSYLHRETSIDEADKKNDANTQQAGEGSVSPPVVQGGIPING
ncbi:uncharacterized protein EAF01_005493 [Botrytis porri]|uniref:mRNA stability protein n=1 Tax=Botrytis porri TaxID=87229 RepID=A0A4Z1KFL8_9HELO|nr:uncharacterized protein EAF01_005493 [Botrytis porri]KAF7904971.1 hypothetical protein EAF01_005493 [Botrytis porri]TGO84837.1 hypothetical protein BPOR_0459g00030 [Botrytis porri]